MPRSSFCATMAMYSSQVAIDLVSMYSITRHASRVYHIPC